MYRFMTLLLFVLCFTVVSVQAFWFFDSEPELIDTEIKIVIPLEGRDKKYRMNAELKAINKTVKQLTKRIADSCLADDKQIRNFSQVPAFRSRVLFNGPHQNGGNLYFKRVTLVTHVNFNLLKEKLCFER